MILRKILRKHPRNTNYNVDEHITENINRFRRSVSRHDIARYRRPVLWEDKIEIIIPCYNHALYLKSAFKSILQQTRHAPITVTFIDDASEDNSADVIRQIKNANKSSWIRIKAINNKSNLNQAGSLNKAISESDNELIVILNADDMLTPDCLELIVETYKSQPSISMLGGMSHWFEDEKKLPVHKIQQLKELKLKIYGPEDAKVFHHLNDINMSQSSCSFFKLAWKLVGGYFEKEHRVCSYDDRDFQMRVCSILPVGVYEDYKMEFYRTSSSTGRATI